MKNKRKNSRYTCFVPVDGKKGSPFALTQTFDISKGGIGLVSPKKIPLNKRIAIELDLSDEGEETVIVIGKVRWVVPDEDTNQYRIGMSFDEIIGGSRSRIEQYFQKTA